MESASHLPGTHDPTLNFLLEISKLRPYIGTRLSDFQEVLNSMNVGRPIRPEQSRALPLGLLKSILNLIGWGVGLVVLLFSNWIPIPMWARYMIIGLIGLLFVVALVLGIIPAYKLLKSWFDSARKTRRQRRSLMQLAEIVQEARMLLDPHLSFSLLSYLNSLCNALVQNQTLHPLTQRLSERLHILSDWHWSLLTFADSGFKQKKLFTRRVRDITRFYQDLANVVRELATIRLPEEDSIRTYDDQLRIVKEKYNQHIGRLEQALETISKVNPEIHAGGFHRF